MKKDKYEGIHLWEGIWGRDKAVLDNKTWKPWTPMVVRPQPGSFKIRTSMEGMPDLAINEILIVNIHNVQETRWITEKDFKAGMKVQINAQMKLNELTAEIEIMKKVLGR